MIRVPGVLDSLRRLLETLESDDRLDVLADVVGRLAEPFGQGVQGAVLRGRVARSRSSSARHRSALGCLMEAGLLDLLVGRGVTEGAELLVGAGVLGFLPTAAAGLAEWPTLSDAAQRRVASVHAAGNGAAAVCYVASWLMRRAGRYRAGVAMSLVGGGLVWTTGYLGGHLSFARAAGQGARWSMVRRASTSSGADPGSCGTAATDDSNRGSPRSQDCVSPSQSGVRHEMSEH
ncbi:hypothetical protein BH23ACT5_BH23ACT5_02310 [soil metagenome]